MSTMMPPVSIFILDDEPQVTDSLTWLLESVRIKPRAFHHPKEFISAVKAFDAPLCAVLDLRLPEMSGLEVQQSLLDAARPIPLLFLSAHGDVPAAVSAMSAGAVTFLQKPFRPQEFLDAVKTLFQLAAEQHARILRATSTREVLALLSPRELQILRLLLEGHTSKEIARELTISHKTVDVHRSNLIRKIGARSLSQLMKILDLTVMAN